MKIAIIVPGYGGVEYHRLAPWFHLVKENKIQIVEINGLQNQHLENIKDCDWVIFNRFLSPSETSTETLLSLKKHGIKLLCDVDDYWNLHQGHVLEHHYRKDGIGKIIQQAIRIADVVTCTHNALADNIRKLNANVHVVPNSINHSEGQWAFVGIGENRTFGWIGSPAHKVDIELLKRPLKKYWQDESLSWRFVLAGWHNNSLNEWMGFEKVITADRIAPIHRYVRIPGEAVQVYGNIINKIDVGLIPLDYNYFNTRKSELKVLEFAAKGKAVIVSDIHPYSNICNEGNSFLCREPMDFYRHMKRIEKNPELAKDKAAKLHEEAKNLYNWDKIMQLRKQIIETEWH